MGVFQDFELAKANKGKTPPLTSEQKKERLNYLLKALSHIWGGGKQSRLLTDMSPKFLAITFQNTKSPIFLETLAVSENEKLNTKAINEVLTGNSRIIKKQLLGVQSGIFKNDDEIIKLSEITDIQTTFSNAVKYINEELFKQ